MQLIYLINYSVKGIKSLDEDVKLSFYKKTISKNPDMNGYNIKGIYGMNGSGKSGIVTSVKILKNILTDSGYLNNPIIQKNLDAIINKKTGQLSIESDFMVKILDSLVVCRYKLILSKDVTGRYSIVYERLSTKKATSRSDNMKIIFEVINGNIEILEIDDGELLKDAIEKTRNLLTMESMSSLFYEKFLIPEAKKKTLQNIMEKSIYIWLLFFFGRKLHVYLDQSLEEKGRQEERLEGRLQGQTKNKLKLIVKKLHKNKSFDQIVDELEEGADVVQPLYDFVLKHIDLNEDEMVQKYLENIE